MRTEGAPTAHSVSNLLLIIACFCQRSQNSLKTTHGHDNHTKKKLRIAHWFIVWPTKHLSKNTVVMQVHQMSFSFLSQSSVYQHCVAIELSAERTSGCIFGVLFQKKISCHLCKNTMWPHFYSTLIWIPFWMIALNILEEISARKQQKPWFNWLSNSYKNCSSVTLQFVPIYTDNLFLNLSRFSILSGIL